MRRARVAASVAISPHRCISPTRDTATRMTPEHGGEERLDELYREHPKAFVAGRDRLAGELRDGGDAEGAARVKKLRRPTVAAWLINRAALSSPAEIEEFADASRQLEQAQARALGGRDEGAEGWRAAAARESGATGAVLDRAESGARDAGHPASARALELAGDTLRAATADPELREKVLRGRVEREQSAATLGTPAPGAPRRRDRRSEKRRETTRARRDLERLESDLGDAREREERARARVEQTGETLRREKAKLADAKREVGAVERRVKAARRRAKR